MPSHYGSRSSVPPNRSRNRTARGAQGVVRRRRRAQARQQGRAQSQPGMQPGLPQGERRIQRMVGGTRANLQLERGTRFTGNASGMERRVSPSTFTRGGGNRAATKSLERRRNITAKRRSEHKRGIPNHYQLVTKRNSTTGKDDKYYCPGNYLTKDCKKWTGKELSQTASTNWRGGPETAHFRRKAHR